MESCFNVCIKSAVLELYENARALKGYEKNVIIIIIFTINRESNIYEINNYKIKYNPTPIKVGVDLQII